MTYYKEKEEAEKTYKTCLELGAADALLVTLDLMDDNSIFHAVDEVVKEHKKIDILVNNAGTLSWTPLQNQSFRDIATQVRTNLEGLIKMTRACLPHVKKTIINIGSIAGTVGMEELTVLCYEVWGEGLYTSLSKGSAAHQRVHRKSRFYRNENDQFPGETS